MELDADVCYQAVLTHDARFDGAFFVGVSSTGIYCRTICPAKTPRRENCRFYPSAAAAERAGHRPCLRCRPELAPGNARVDATGRLAAMALSLIEDGALTEGGVVDLAATLGVSDRHLRRVTLDEFGVTPVELAQTQRLLLAKRLLTDTDLPITEIAFASGFASVRRFNALFRERYRLQPTDLRKRRGAPVPAQTLLCDLAFRPPLEWETLRDYFGNRAIRGVEAVDDAGRYVRTVAAGRTRGWLAVTPVPGKNALRVEMSASLAPAIPAVLAGIKRQFDLAAQPDRIACRLGALAENRPGLRVPGAFDGFETAVRMVLGQQITVRAATTLAGRLSAAFGEPIETPAPAILTHLPISAARIARAETSELAELGIISARARSIIELARAVEGGRLRLVPGGDIEATLEALKGLPGIGDWTAQCIALRVLAWPDAFPHGDLGIRRALGEDDPKRLLALAESWRPWRSYAAMHLWHRASAPAA